MLFTLTLVRAESNRLFTIQLQVPGGLSALDHQCRESLDAALADRKEEEAREGAACLVNMNYNQMQDLTKNFVATCTREIRRNALASGPGPYEYPKDKVRTLFNTSYGNYFRGQCLERALRNSSSGGGDATTGPREPESPTIQNAYDRR